MMRSYLSRVTLKRQCVVFVEKGEQKNSSLEYYVSRTALEQWSEKWSGHVFPCRRANSHADAAAAAADDDDAGGGGDDDIHVCNNCDDDNDDGNDVFCVCIRLLSSITMGIILIFASHVICV